MSPDAGEIDPAFAELRRLKSPRPGHADLAGGAKYLRRDLRDVLERASARESAARVAAGAFAKMLLAEARDRDRERRALAGAASASTVPAPAWADLRDVDDASPLRAIRRELEPAMVALVDEAKAKGDTLGGAATVIAHGVPVGLGSHVAWDEKLDGRIAQAMMSIPAVKAVEIGDAIESLARLRQRRRTTPSSSPPGAASGDPPTAPAGWRAASPTARTWW